MEINGAALGFGVAAVAGLTLALIGHPSTSYVPQTLTPVAPTGFVLKSVSVDLPTSDVAFPGGAKADVIAANCLSCHSAGMVLTQPDLSKVVWTGIVEKMIHAYKAPVAEGDVAAIVDYLDATKGSK